MITALMTAAWLSGLCADVVWQQYRELELPGATMEQIADGVWRWAWAEEHEGRYTCSVDTVDSVNGYANLSGSCTFAYNPKGYWCQGLPKGDVCHALYQMTARDGVLKVWFTRFSFGRDASGLFHECNGVSYDSGPICEKVPERLVGTDRFGAKLLYRHVKPHMLKWMESQIGEIDKWVKEVSCGEQE